MRILTVLVFAFAAACGKSPQATGAAAESPPLLRASLVPENTEVVVDGRIADAAWRRSVELVVPLTGAGPTEVKLKAAHDGQRLYLLAVWEDADKSYNRFWKRTGVVEFEKTVREDGFAVCWAPNSLADRFREQGCALFCHDGGHVYPEDGSGFVDFWYWGAQQHVLYPQASDQWLRFGSKHRLRGDSQPEDSGNLKNVSTEYDGPRYYPYKVKRDTATRLLDHGNVNLVTKKILTQKIAGEHNFGREIPLDVQRARKGSRGDVEARAIHHKGKSWILEMARDLETGNRDDLPLVLDPLVTYLFAVAIYNDAGGADHTASSAPIALRLQ